MELNTEILTGPARPAATVMMLRDATQGLQVFLIKRHGLSDVLGGAYVFPGGKVDEGDARLDLAAHLDLPPSVLRAALNEPGQGELAAAGLYVAALREVFEETGVLYAHGADNVLAARAATLSREGRAFGEVLALLRLRLSAADLLPWSRWITPRRASVAHKRFDTRFFVAATAPGQEAAHDNHEATDSVWLSPRMALEQYWQRRIELAPPQIMSLAHLSRHATVAQVLEEARRHPPPVIEPQAFEHQGGRVICYPGDPRHPVRERTLPGPTRLYYRDKRFEPEGGFEALFG